MCSVPIPADHRHLLHVEDRLIVCTCETCRALFSGEGAYRPTGSRTVWLDGLDLSDELWASFRIPIGLAFFFQSSAGGPGGTAVSSRSTRARPAPPSASSTSRRGFGSWPRTRCSSPSNPMPRR